MSTIYIDKNIDVAVNFDNKILDIMDLNDDILKNIYRARVEKILKNQKSAFVNLGEEYGFLELPGNCELREQDEILVQVKKIKGDDKYVELSAEISLEGEFIIFFPEKKFIKYSKKLNSDPRNKLREFAKKENLWGVLFRSKAELATEEDILEEYKSLQNFSADIISQRNKRPTPKLIYRKDKLKSFLNACDFENILTNDMEIHKKYKNDFDVKFDDNFRIIYNADILRDYKSLFSKKIELEDGGDIIIEQTEALCSIDVNSSGYKSNLNHEDHIYSINKKAAEEIARQIMLRNISGIIIIDTINMNSKENREKLLADYREYLKRDNVFSKVYGYTALGLIEISRENRGYALIDKLGEQI